MSRASFRRVPRIAIGVLVTLVFLAAPAAATPPPNDACTAATPITATPFTDVVDATGATTEPTDPTATCGCSDHSVWYSFSPAQAVDVTVSATQSPNYYVINRVLVGSCDTNTFLDCRVAPPVSFRACAGTTYLIEVANICGRPLSSYFLNVSATLADADGDGVDDCTDNCRTVPNPGQEDADGDGTGDACDRCPGSPDGNDADQDGVPDACDDCPLAWNPGQEDWNTDGVGDECQDSDGDGDLDARDNCKVVPNPGQEDEDRDGLGDACDPCLDYDHDGFGVGSCPPDNCPRNANPDQTDSLGNGTGDACRVCAILGEVANWSAITTQSLSVRESSGYHETSAFLGPVCTGKATLQNVDVGGASSGFGYNVADLVALASGGVAVHAQRPATGCYYCEGFDSIDGPLITGGGRVAGLENLFIDPAIPDTSGTHPRLGDCRRAMAAAADASARLAALPPTHVFGNVHIGIGEKVTIDARGGAVIQMDSLRMEGGRQTLFDVDPVVRACDSGFDDALSRLQILSNEGDQVVINVPSLTLGSCAQPDMKDGVINVPGSGGSIRVGTQVGYGYSASPVLLAPGRKVSILGSAIDLPPTFSAIYAKSLKTTGFVLVENQWGDNLPCHPY
jgi:hypothetical protein